MAGGIFPARYWLVNEPALANAGPSDARALRQSMRQDDWLGAIDRRLCVVALDEAAQSAQASSGSDEPLSRPKTNALKVLVVDDNFDVTQTVGWMLETIGHDYRMVCIIGAAGRRRRRLKRIRQKQSPSNPQSSRRRKCSRSLI
jgi:hypothetical protein